MFVVFIKFTTWSVPITAVLRPSHGKFVFGLTDVLFVANNTCRHINAIACAYEVLVEFEVFRFAHYL